MRSLRNKDHNTAVKFTGSHRDERIFLSGIASAFYDGGSLSLHRELSCSSITRINDFLDELRNELHAGVPGKWLTTVLGKASSGKFLLCSFMHTVHKKLPHFKEALLNQFLSSYYIVSQHAEDT